MRTEHQLLTASAGCLLKWSALSLFGVVEAALGEWVTAVGRGISLLHQRTGSYTLFGGSHTHPSQFCLRPLGAPHPSWHWSFACGLNLLIPGACKNKHFQALDKRFDFILNRIVNIQLQGLQVRLLENFLLLDLSQITRSSPPPIQPPWHTQLWACENKSSWA